MTSATEVLRRMLDERGVEWGNIRNDGSESDYLTEWQFDGIEGHAIATEWSVGHLTVCIVHPMTPAQAIAATLGTGTCHNTQFAEMDEKSGKKYSMAMSALRFGGFMPEDEPAEFTCSACGETASIDWETFYDIRFCPFCGRKVVSE